MNPSKIRNFCIIAHIDHGKSTIADRMMELTGTVSAREMEIPTPRFYGTRAREGITIKLTPVQMKWRDYTLNLIDLLVLSISPTKFLVLSSTSKQPSSSSTQLRASSPNPRQCLPRPRAGPLHYLVINKIDLPAADVESQRRISLIFSAVRLKKSSQSPAKPVSILTTILIALLKPRLRASSASQPTGATRALISTPISMIIAVLFLCPHFRG